MVIIVEHQIFISMSCVIITAVTFFPKYFLSKCYSLYS